MKGWWRVQLSGAKEGRMDRVPEASEGWGWRNSTLQGPEAAKSSGGEIPYESMCVSYLD